MDQFEKLPSIFHAREAYAIGITPADLKSATEKGLLERRMRGVYKKVDSEDYGEWTNYEVLSKGLKCRFAVCLLSALSYYGLTDLILEEQWILVDHKAPINHVGVRFFRTRNPHWDIGIHLIDGIPFTTVERTIVECLVHKKIVGPTAGHGALVQAINQKKVTPWDIGNMALAMGVSHRVETYMEPFIYAS